MNTAEAPSKGVLGARSEKATRLRRRLRGDLDNIVLKALRKEPERRYASAEQLAEDIRRHLQGLPVTATPDSLSYRAGKFVRRHRFGVAAAALIVVAIAAGVIATVREARIAEINRRHAENRFNDVRKLANSLMFEIHDSIRDLPGSTPARRLLVTRALEYLDSLSQESRGDSSLQRELAAAYERVGDVLGYPYGANLGDTHGALQSYHKALALRESLAAASPHDPQLQSDLAESYFRIAQTSEAGGDFSAALDAMRKALPITQRMAVGQTRPERLDDLAGSYYFTAELLDQTGDPEGAQGNYQRAAAVRQAALQANPRNVPLRAHLAGDYAGQAWSLVEKRDLTGAVAMQSRAIGILEDVSRENPQSAALREYLGEAVNRIARIRQMQGNFPAALEAYRRSHGIFRDLVAADAKDSLARANFGFSDNGIGRCQIALKQPVAALQAFHEAAATFESMSPGTSKNRYVRSGLADTYSEMGWAYSALAMKEGTGARVRHTYWQQARQLCEKSLAIWREKEKRNELESSERTEAKRVSQCIARCDAQLATRPGPP